MTRLVGDDDVGRLGIGLVDDDAMALMALSSLIRRRLGNIGVKVRWAERSGVAAVERCVDRHTRPDVVLVDMGMDDVDGAEVCRRLRRLSNRLVVLCITSHSLARYGPIAREAGAQALLDKANWGDVEQCLRQCAVDGDAYAQNGFPTPAKACCAAWASSVERSPDKLSVREREIMDLTVQGRTAKEVAAVLCISESTVKTHVRSVIAKLGVRNKYQAISRWNEMKG